MLPIIIPTVSVGSPAALALTMEGLEVTEVVMSDRFHYGRFFTEQWQSGNGFVSVEDDIVPWPGAFNEMVGCERGWCCFKAPNGIVVWEPLSGCGDGLACMKFATELVQRTPYGADWQNRGWDELDGAVHRVLLDAGESLHVHTPPAAHVKATALTSRRVMLPIAG